MKGKIIVIEGGDGSGKKVQTDRLFARLLEEQYNVRKISFPNYASDSSALIKMYLRGDFGTHPEDVSPYIASTFFAVDRYASYKTDWKQFYVDGGIILLDRYTTANMIHQASKMHDESERERFLDWLWRLEFDMFNLPVPDSVIFLNMPPKYSKQLIKNRNNKITGEQEKDIHEKSEQHLIDAYNIACEVADKYNWAKIDCVKDGEIRSIDDIHEELYQIANKNCLKA